MDNPEKLTVVEFCAGYGGIHLGLKRAIPNLQLIAVSEIEAFAIANLVSKMEAGCMDAAPIWPDIKTFPNSEFYGLVDLLVAGFPCQPFSQAGKRGGSDDPRHLFPYIKQSLVDMQPRYVFLENVEGIISSKLGEGWADPAGTSVLLHVLRELERVGYRATAGVFSAAEVGAPHQRKRVFILGCLENSQPSGSGSEGRNPLYEGRSASQTGGEGLQETTGRTTRSPESDDQPTGADELVDAPHQRKRVFILGYREHNGPHGLPDTRGGSEASNRSEERSFTPSKSQRTSRSYDKRDLQTSELVDAQQQGPRRLFRSEDMELQGEKKSERSATKKSLFRNVWPSRPGEPQYEWEPPRVTGGMAQYTDEGALRRDGSEEEADSGSREEGWDDNVQREKTQPPVGRDADGFTGRLDYAELYESCDNRVDELRLLGNGVVPATAERAWRILYSRLHGGS